MLIRKDLLNKLIDLASISIEYLNSKDEDIKWITVKGNHIPIKKGQSEDEAVKAFLSKVESKGSKKVTDKTKTKEFKDWFDTSEVTDKNGNPLIVFHGTYKKDIEEFEPNNIDGTAAIYFSSNKSTALDYSENDILYEVYLKIENPLKIDAQNKDYNDFTVEMRSNLDYAKRNGYDGVIVENIKDSKQGSKGRSATTYIVFEPNQIKSKNNKGSFDINSDNINE